ncbi:porimin [Peromyscus californicus insignis]|uniref:porimin n=1 Tax=Peromyscus californicus insignis TaxID=564181 RepID=UPI0022A75DEE|nr:porimin [Peromyscus californicus insignis]
MPVFSGWLIATSDISLVNVEQINQLIHDQDTSITDKLCWSRTRPNPHRKTSVQSLSSGRRARPLPASGREKGRRGPCTQLRPRPARKATPSPASERPAPSRLGLIRFEEPRPHPASFGHALSASPLFSEPRPLWFGSFPRPRLLWATPLLTLRTTPRPRPSPARALFGHWGDQRGRRRCRGAGRGGRDAERSRAWRAARAPCGRCGRSGALGTMALCARAALLLLLLGALQVLALPGAAADGSPGGNISVPLLTSSVNVTENITVHMTSNQTKEFNSSTVKPVVTSRLPKTVTAVTLKPTTIAKTSTPGVSPHSNSTASKSTPKASASPNSTHTSASVTTTGPSSLKTSITITATIHSDKSKGSRFDTGSFVGGIVLTLGVLAVLYIGCKMYYSRRGIRYRSIDEHDAII